MPWDVTGDMSLLRWDGARGPCHCEHNSLGTVPMCLTTGDTSLLPPGTKPGHGTQAGTAGIPHPMHHHQAEPPNPGVVSPEKVTSQEGTATTKQSHPTLGWSTPAPRR